MTCACARASKKETHFRSTGCIRSYWHSVCKRHAVHHFSHPAKSKVLISFVHVTKSGNVTCGHQKLPKFWAIFPHWDNYSFQKNNHCYAAFEPIKLRVWALLSEHSPITKPKDASPSGALVKEQGCEDPLCNSPQPMGLMEPISANFTRYSKQLRFAEWVAECSTSRHWFKSSALGESTTPFGMHQFVPGGE